MNATNTSMNNMMEATPKCNNSNKLNKQVHVRSISTVIIKAVNLINSRFIINSN